MLRKHLVIVEVRIFYRTDALRDVQIQSKCCMQSADSRELTHLKSCKVYKVYYCNVKVIT